ncbi:zinc transporter ZntB [Aliivibrio finisterrensis]|uniref:zinc transporter ZntB n=1 Tax=Aliivibrio finisterrensis TaxID=511998 RepID=UPI001FCB621C|nr:zinc transporter ZntB [Aliivibrio finisterrensis]
MNDTNNPPKGFFHALVLDQKGGANKLSWEDVLQSWNSQDKLWLHLDYTDQQLHSWLQNNTKLNDIILDTLFNEDSRPNVMSRDNELSAVFRGINVNPNSKPEDMVSIRLWTDGRRMLSTRKRALISTQEIVTDLNNGTGPKEIPQLLISWVDKIIKGMSETVDTLEGILLQQENEFDDGDLSLIRSTLHDTRKQSSKIRHFLAPQRDALNRLVNKQLDWLNDMHRLKLNSIAAQQVLHIEDIDAVRDRIVMLQEEITNEISEQMNQRSYVLTIVAAIFLPLSFFTGLMGINVGGMPGLDSSIGFWIVSSICLIVSVVMVGIFIWKKWI